MKRGLIIGKFMPIHKGHIALINFALSHCDEVTVSMSFTEQDPINPEQRLRWIKEIFERNPKISIHLVKDDFDQEDLLWNERIKIWSDFVKSKYPHTNVIVSSEAYGSLLAEKLGIDHISFDLTRMQVPISATRIRENPFQHWEYIPKEARPYFVKKICLYGPESTGKSSMAIRMAEVYNTEFVPEVAREMVSSNDFALDDIIRIGQAQTDRVFEKLTEANKVLFCDSDLITTQIYSRHYLKEVPSVLYKLEDQIKYDFYFLFDIDTPWVEDGLRDLGKRREEMFAIFKNELECRGIAYILVKGNWNERERIVRSEVDKLLS
jgi:HTH-type transcriptional regulator, transcriptional repressor of NAD biosynthesis genes